MVAFPRVAGKLRLQGTSMLELVKEDSRLIKSEAQPGQDILRSRLWQSVTPGATPCHTHIPEMWLYAKFRDTSRVISETLSAARLPDSAL